MQPTASSRMERDASNGVDAWRRLMFHNEPNLASTTQCHLKAILAIPRAKDATDAVSNVPRLDDLIRRYEKARNKDLDEELKVQRMFDILPSTIKQHLMLEHRDKETTFDDLRKRALTWIMTHTSGKAPMIDSLAETARPFDDEFHNKEHNDEEAYGGDVMGFKGGAKGGKNVKGGSQGTCWVCNEHGHSAKYCPYGDQKGKGKGGGSQRGNFKGNAKGTKRRREHAHHVHTGWPTLEADDFPGGGREQSAGIGVQDREQW